MNHGRNTFACPQCGHVGPSFFFFPGTGYNAPLKGVMGARFLTPCHAGVTIEAKLGAYRRSLRGVAFAGEGTRPPGTGARMERPASRPTPAPSRSTTGGASAGSVAARERADGARSSGQCDGGTWCPPSAERLVQRRRRWGRSPKGEWTSRGPQHAFQGIALRSSRLFSYSTLRSGSGPSSSSSRKGGARKST